MDLKQIVLNTFRSQWAEALKQKFGDDPSKLRDVDMAALAEEMFGHDFVSASLGSVGVTSADVAGALEDVRRDLLEDVWVAGMSEGAEKLLEADKEVDNG